MWLPSVCVLLALSAVACATPSRLASRGSGQAVANRSAGQLIEVSPSDADAASDDPCAEMFSNLFVEMDSILYSKYEVVRLYKTVRDKEYGTNIEVTYAILKSGGRTIKTFEGIYFGAGNQTDFGYASLLGGDTRQLLVSQTIPRDGRHWIVDLSSDATTLFDSKEWGLGQEDVCIHDFDGDGVQEISLAIKSFWGFDAMSMAESPMPGVVFKYDPNARKYLPDKIAFTRGLTDIDEDIKKIDPDEVPRNGLKGPYLAIRLDVLLRYVYAGREDDGWSFFDRTYKLPDKPEMSRAIKRILNSEPVHSFIYGTRPLNRRAS